MQVAPAEADTIRHVSSGRGYAVLASRRLFVSILEGEPTMEGSRAQAAWARDGVSKTPRSVGCMVVLGASTAPPSSDVRAEIPRLLQAIATPSAGLAMVIEGDGFRAATLRAVFTGFLLLRPLPYETMVFSTIREGLDWLARSVPIDPRAARTQVDELRRTHLDR